MEIGFWDDAIVEVIDATIAGSIEPATGASKASQLCSKKEQKEFLLDYVWMESFRENEESADRMQELIGRLVEMRCLDISSVIGLLEPESIPVEVITEDSLRRKRTQTKTKRLYTVPKFNLLSECVEGFAVVIDIGWACVMESVSLSEVSLVAVKLKEAIGYFSLCPSKALAVLVSMMSWGESGGGQLVELIRQVFPKERVTSVLKFHLLSYRNSEEIFSETPRGFIKAISTLCAAGLVDVAEAWSVMGPSSAEISECAASIIAEYELQLEAVTRTLGGALGTTTSAEEEDPDVKLSACVSRVSRKLESSQRFMFVEELARSGQWDFASPLLNHLQNLFGSVPLGAVDTLREVLIDAIFATVTASKNAMSAEEQEQQLTEWLAHLLKFVGVYIGSSPAVLGDLFGLCPSDFILADFLLPALCVSCPSPALSAKAWECIRARAPAERYLLYQRWEEAYEKIFPLKLVKLVETTQTRALLKRVVKTAQVGDLVSRTSHLAFAKQTCSNPLIGLAYVVSNIQIHFNVNLIEPYVEVVSKISPLAQDVASYLIAVAVGSGKEPLHVKTASVEAWLSNLSDFTGRFHKKHPGAPLDGLMRLIVAFMVKKEVVTTGRVLLESVISHMGGFTVVNQLNGEQLESLAGGPVLNSLMQSSNSSSQQKNFDGIKMTERARTALKDALLADPSIVRTLWRCLFEQLSQLTTSQRKAQEFLMGGGLKLLGILYDGMHSCLLQLTQFLAIVCSKEEYALLQPLRSVENMEQGLAMHILRPCGIGAEIACTNSANLSINFIARFWSLSLYDIAFPAAHYEKQIQIIREKIIAQEQLVASLERVRGSEEAKEQFRAARRDLARLKDTHAKLEDEFAAHAVRFSEVEAILHVEKNSWWTEGIGNRASTLYFVEHLIAKRVTLSVQDALFCSHFIKILAKKNVVGFQFLDFMNQWTELLSQMVSTASEGEVRTFAEFVCDMMKFVVDLRRDETKFEQLVTSENPVFNRNYFSPEKGEIVPITQSELKRGHLKWESSIAKSLKSALNKDTSDWSEKRNCLILLSKTCEIFPLIQLNATDLIKTVQELTAGQEDIATLALSLSRRLASLESNWLDKIGDSPEPAAPSPIEEIEKRSKAPVITRRPREDPSPRAVKRPTTRAELEDYGPKRSRPDERDRLPPRHLARGPDMGPITRQRAPPRR